MAMLDGLLDTDLGRLLMQAAAAGHGGVDEGGFDPNFKMPKAPAKPGAPGIPAGLLASMMPNAGGSEMMFDPEGRPIDPFYAAGVGKPKAADDPWGKNAAPVPAVGGIAGLLAGMPGIEGAGAPQQWESGPFADRPPTNDPSSFEPKVEVPMPRPRPAGLDAPMSAPLSLNPSDHQDELPTNSTPAEGRTAPPAPDGPGFLERLGGKIFDPNKAATWMALGSGFAGAGSIGTGIRRASAAAVPAMAADRAQQLKQQTISDTYRALIAKGVPPAEALAASQNPEIMKATAAKYFEAKPRVPHKLGTDMMGNDIMGSFDPNTGIFYDAANNAIGGGTGGGPGGKGVQIPGTNANVLAKGVTDYNSDLPADEYMAQFSPEVQASMKAYIRGDTMPTSNPRLKALATKVKEWSTTYGDKAGIPVSDATFSEKRKFRTEYGSSSPSTIGGQSKAFNQGVEHLDALATKLEGLKNVDPVGIPAVAAGANWMRQAFSTKQTGLAKEAAGIGQTLAGEVGKLFSGTAGGGVHERELTRQRFNTITSPDELAGALEATVETMEGGLRALETRRDQAMGPNSDIELATKGTMAKIARVREVIARLRSGEAPAEAKPAPGVTSTGIKWSIQPNAGP